MKTCVIYAGQARSHRMLWENHAFFLLQELPSPTIFASVQDDERADDMLLLRQAGYEVHLEKHKQPETIEVPQQTEHHFGYPVTSKAGPAGVLKQLWALNKAWEFVGERAKEFDFFVRVRPDLKFCRFVMPGFPVTNRVELTDDGYDLVSETDDRACLTPWAATWGGINDRFALMGRAAAEAYFTTFQRKDEFFAKRCPCHTETMMGYSLKTAGITPSATLDTEMFLLRENGDLEKEPASLRDLATFARRP